MKTLDLIIPEEFCQKEETSGKTVSQVEECSQFGGNSYNWHLSKVTEPLIS